MDNACPAGLLSKGSWVQLGIVTTIILGILLVKHIYRALKHCTIQHSSAAGGVHRGGRAVHGAVLFVPALRRSVSFCYSVHYRQLFCGSKISAPPLCRFLSDAPRARVLTTGDWLGGTYACERSESYWVLSYRYKKVPPPVGNKFFRQLNICLIKSHFFS